MGVPTPTQAPTPFPEGDPRNGKYFETLAALEHQLNSTLASDKQQLTDAQAAYQYSTGQLDHQLPLTLQGTRDRANSEGLAQSGALVQRSGGVEAKYAAQRGRLTTGLQQTEGRIHQGEANAEEGFNLGRTRAAQSAREEAKAQLEREAPNQAQSPPQYPGIPAGATLGPAGPGGVVPYETSGPNFVRVGAARAAALRRQAAKKAVG